MTPLRTKRRLPALLVGATALALTAVAAPAVAATPADSAGDSSGHAARHTISGPVTARAAGAGVTRSGGGFMGWAQRGTSAVQHRTVQHSDAAAATPGAVYGIDVSRYQGNVNWASYYAQGKRFAYVKATEGSTYTSPTFSQQYAGAAQRGLVRGAYHFANPAGAAGSTQARFFVAHGGGWSRDGRTLPGVLDIEYNPYGSTCYGLSQASMRSWISSFTTTYRALTGREAVIYSTTDWWTRCTGNTSAFASRNPLWIARYSSSPGTLPAGWSFYTFWQYSSSPIDQDRFNGGTDRLRALALG